MALSLFAKLLMMERDSWKRELPVSATSEISWLTAMIIWREKEANGDKMRGWLERRRWRKGRNGVDQEEKKMEGGKKNNKANALNGICIDRVQWELAESWTAFWYCVSNTLFTFLICLMKATEALGGTCVCVWTKGSFSRGNIKLIKYWDQEKPCYRPPSVLTAWLLFSEHLTCMRRGRSFRGMTCFLKQKLPAGACVGRSSSWCTHSCSSSADRAGLMPRPSETLAWRHSTWAPRSTGPRKASHGP